MNPPATTYTRITGTGSHLPPRRLSNADMVAMLAARGIAVSHDTVWRFLRREGRSFKKNRIRQ